ncbi:hypothetical protein ACKS0A_01055 [Histoplasma ohiense]
MRQRREFCTDSDSKSVSPKKKNRRNFCIPPCNERAKRRDKRRHRNGRRGREKEIFTRMLKR